MKREKEGTAVIGGYVVTWNTIYDMGGYYERIAPGALDKADITDVACLFNHDMSQILSRTTSGSLKLKIDSKGLYYSATLPDSDLGEYIEDMVTRGDVFQSFWGFTGVSETWSVTKDGSQLRTITSVQKVWDASPVTFPANPATSVMLVSESTKSKKTAPYSDPYAQETESAEVDPYDADFARMGRQLAADIQYQGLN
jgi:hypothetical protein